MCFEKRELFRYLTAEKGVLSSSPQDVLAFLNQKHPSLTVDDSFRNFAKKFIPNLKRRWQSSRRYEKTFLQQNEGWLKETVCTAGPDCPSSPAATAGGRPRRSPFPELSRRSKLRATEDLRERSRSELVFAAASATHQDGRRSAAKLVEAAGSPRRGPDLAARLAKPPQSPKPYTSGQALALFIELNLTKAQYVTIQQSAKTQHSNIYPIYDRVRLEKAACMPPQETMAIEEGRASVQLQSLLNHSSRRLLQLQSVVVRQLLDSGHQPPLKLTLTCKWGMDGSTGQSQYKQAGLPHDSQVFMTSLVPLRLVTDRGELVWNNLTPGSPRFCRPITLQFVKETAELIREEQALREAEIAALCPLRTDLADITYQLQLTMLDGKAVNAITWTASSQTCSMCGATPAMVNNLSAVTARPVHNTEYGISTLHCWIRVFEALLHVAYRLPLKTWRVRASDKPKLLAEKTKIQQKFREQLGLRVDEPRAGGSGNSDDGNTARRAFRSPAVFAACTGIDERLILQLHVLLQAVSCAHPLSIPAVIQHCSETAERYVLLYPWYPMPPTLHKLLIHTANVVEACVLPIGMMSEEASESRNKHVREYRLHHTRKDSRLHTMSDLFGYLLVSSDPLISGSDMHLRRAEGRRRARPMLPEALALLAEPQVLAGAESGCASDSSDEE